MCTKGMIVELVFCSRWSASILLLLLNFQWAKLAIEGKPEYYKLGLCPFKLYLYSHQNKYSSDDNV